MTRHEYYTADEVREFDRIAIEEQHVPGITLMQRAGRATFNALITRWPDARDILVFCGTGNNGGDGSIVAGLALEAGLRVHVFLVGDESAVSGDALKALHFAQAYGARIQPAANAEDCIELLKDDLDVSAVIVDALLGTGIRGEVRPDYWQLIELINDSGLPVVAIDIPSGLCSDTGEVRGVAVEADVTVTFIARKIGQVQAAGPAHCGALVFDDLDVHIANNA